MIRLLQGTVHDHDERTIILFVNGVGYQVMVPSNFKSEDNEELTLYIHTHVREDTLALYGFRTKNELNFFEILLNVNGIGPKMAMEILNEPTDKIENAILTGNIPVLTSISGIGKKIAERLILELKSKLDPKNLVLKKYDQSHSEVNEDAITALENLGYKRNHVQKVLAEIDDKPEKTEDLIRLFLQRA